MPKKQAKNAFWFFMSEWKKSEERKGRTFPNGYRDVQADPGCNEAWRALSPAQKGPYVSMAKNSKLEPNRGKLAGTGESIAVIKQQEQDLEDFKLNMDAHIRLTVANAKKYKSLASLTFPFIHMNYYYMRKPDVGPIEFCPAEFAIAEFSIEKGVSRFYHEIVKTEIFLGYAREAMETSEQTHKLYWDLPDAEGDWAIMYHKMKTFLEPLMIDDNIPPIYTAKKFMHIVPSLLRKITAAVGQPEDKFTVYSLEVLYGHMLRAVTDHPESNIVAILAETQLSKELFAYTSNIECDYHKMQDGSSQFCSLSIVRQWGFEFCDQCCRPLGVKMIPGIHCPESAKGALSNNAFNGSSQSLASVYPVSVLSATGVSQQHRIAVSERTRRDEARRRRENRPVQIIDHSLLTDEERPPVPEPEPIGEAIPSANSGSTNSLRAPVTASQALMGVRRVVPLFNGENFPAIGGRGSPVRPETRRMEGPIWCHRGNRNSDSD